MKHTIKKFQVFLLTIIILFNITRSVVGGECSRGVMVKAMDSRIVVSEFEL